MNRTMHRLWSILLLSCGVSSFVSASEAYPTVSDIFFNILHDQKAIVTSPARADRTDIAVWGAAGLSAVVLMPNYGDYRSIGERTAEGINREHGQYGRLFKRVTLVGDGRVLFGASLATYGIASLTDESEWQQGSARWIEALTDTSLWVTAIKVVAGRNRPSDVKPQSHFTGPQGYFKHQGTNSSFPSGHTALAFASATILTRETGNNPWIGVPAYLTAGAVGFSRVYVERHWLTDTFFGAALGYGIGSLVENRRHRDKRAAWHLEPSMGEHYAGGRFVLKY